jgi:hypothetical protein
MMNIDNLASMFSQRNGVQQSMSSSIMSAIMGYIMQKGMGSMLSGGSGSGGGSEGIKSMLSNLGGGSGQGINQDHELVKHVQQNAGIKDPQQASQYTRQGLDLMNEQADKNPQGLQSLLGNFLGASVSGQQNKGGSDRGSFLDNVI